jgi:hypothetical protein
MEFGAVSGNTAYDMSNDSLVLAVETVTSETFTSTTSCNVDTLVVLMTTSGGDYIDGHCVNDMMTYLDKAKRAFELLSIHGTGTPEDKIQGGIAAAVHLSMLMGNGTAWALNSSIGTSSEVLNKVPVPMNKKSYQLYRYHMPWNINLMPNWSRITTHAFFLPWPLENYQRDMMMVNNAVNAFTTDSTVKADLDNFLRDILQRESPEVIDDDYISSVSTSGITHYISEHLSAE